MLSPWRGGEARLNTPLVNMPAAILDGFAGEGHSRVQLAPEPDSSRHVLSGANQPESFKKRTRKGVVL